MTKKIFQTFTLFLAIFVLASCGDDDDIIVDPGPQPTGNEKVYTLNSLGGSGIAGTATFIEINDGSTDVEINLQNTPANGSHPTHIHFNTAAESGGIAVSLGPVDGASGMLTTNVTALDDGTPISYSELLNFNGYINVHESATNLANVISQGDIGQNELTGTTMAFDLDEDDVAGINGTATFSQRVNGTTLLVIALNGTSPGASHPSHIHQGNIGSGGDIIVGLNPVDGDTGMSVTQISELVGGAAVTYSDLSTIEAYINVHMSDSDLGTIVARGNIGSSTGNSDRITYNVTNNGASAYIWNGNGLSSAMNPDITLERGKTYDFVINSPGHPFIIKDVQGNGTDNAFASGVTNNGIISGTITFTVPNDAPDTLFYNCQFHGAMTGTFNITG